MVNLKFDIPELVKEVKSFSTKEIGVELTDSQAVKLIDYIINKTEKHIHTQATLESHYDIEQQLFSILGIERAKLH